MGLIPIYPHFLKESLLSYYNLNDCTLNKHIIAMPSSGELICYQQINKILGSLRNLSLLVCSSRLLVLFGRIRGEKCGCRRFRSHIIAICRREKVCSELVDPIFLRGRVGLRHGIFHAPSNVCKALVLRFL